MALFKKIGLGLAAAGFALTLAASTSEAQRRHWVGDGCDHGVNRSYGRSTYRDGYNERGSYDRGRSNRDSYYDRGSYNRSRSVVTYRSYSGGSRSYYPSSYSNRGNSRYRSNSRYYSSYPSYSYYPSYNSYRSYPRYRRGSRSGLSVSFGLGW